MRQDTFTLGEGQLLIQFPANLSPESFEDLTDWLVLQHRKIGRTVTDEKAKKIRIKRDDGQENKA